jgi:hypothetical protein
MKYFVLVIFLFLFSSCGTQYVITGFDDCKYIGYVRCNIHYRNLETKETGFVQAQKNPLKVGNVVRIKFKSTPKIKIIREKIK